MKEFIMNEILSRYYDNEIGLSKRIKIEAQIAHNPDLQYKMSKTLFVYYLISKSIKQAKRRVSILHLSRLP